jgi:hypothetical protein
MAQSWFSQLKEAKYCVSEKYQNVIGLMLMGLLLVDIYLQQVNFSTAIYHY